MRENCPSPRAVDLREGFNRGIVESLSILKQQINTETGFSKKPCIIEEDDTGHFCPEAFLPVIC